MKRIILVLALLSGASLQQGFAQDSGKSVSGSNLLASYYSIKDALVGSDAAATGIKADDFVKAIKGIDKKLMAASPEFLSLQEKLIFDAEHIAESKDLTHQRDHFADFSVNFYKLAKTVKLTDQPVYYAFCPMKKSYWLSAEAAIKNPYYGKMMLTCGNVSETINVKK